MGWPATPNAKMGVLETTFILLGGGSATPIWLRVGSATPKGQNFFFFFFFFTLALGGGRTTLKGHGGGSATPRQADIGVADPTPGQMGVAKATPIARPPLNLAF